MHITTLGIDLAKSVFQLHGVDADGSVVLKRKVRRRALLETLSKLAPCLVGMEACATSHYWARDLLVRQRTMLINALCAHLAEFGIISARGPHKIRDLCTRLKEDHLDIPQVARLALLSLVGRMDGLEEEITELDRNIHAWHRASEVSQRLATIPGVGVLTATALAATVADPSQFQSARQFAAWLGLVPRQNSSGGKDRLGRITKMGDGYLRKLLVVGATAVLRRISHAQTQIAEWVRCLLKNKPARLVSVALANKTARIVWAVMSKKEAYKPA